MIRVNARFIGTNSLGFRNNLRYDITIIDKKMGDIENVDNRMLRVETSDDKVVEYSSWERLIMNWELLSSKEVGGYSEEYLPNKIKEYLRERKINKVLNG